MSDIDITLAIRHAADSAMIVAVTSYHGEARHHVIVLFAHTKSIAAVTALSYAKIRCQPHFCCHTIRYATATRHARRVLRQPYIIGAGMMLMPLYDVIDATRYDIADIRR